MSGVLLDPFDGAIIENETDVPTGDVMDALRDNRQLIAQFSRWSQEAQGYTAQQFNTWNAPNTYGPTAGNPRARAGGLFERDKYITPYSQYMQMRVAQEAVESDDVVSGVADTTEALAFNRVSMFAEDSDEQDVYNQIAADIDLDSRLREMWRELFTISQFTAAIWWDNKTYKVRGTTDRGNIRRKEITVRCPKAITLLDPLKVVPLGNTMFNRDQLIYVADRSEADNFDDALANFNDPIVNRLIVSRYEATPEEQAWMGGEGLNPTDLFILNSATVFRHAVTRPQYKRLAAIRMKSIFELLDMKHQLRASDRAHLVGSSNFIVLIKKGTDQMPGKPAEIANLQEQVKTIARLPVLIGDHRLSVDIVTPKLDQTLDGERYSTLDARITARLYGMFVLGGRRASVGTTTDDSTGLMKIVARGIESRRHMLQRSLERFIFNPLFQQNESLQTAPKLKFHPHTVDLTFDAAFASFLMELRQSNELSRETLLSQFDIDQADEAQMLEREKEQYDRVFLTQVPFSTQNPRNQDPSPTNPTDPVGRGAQRRAGRQGGGTRNGGGAAPPNSGQGQEPRNPMRRSD